MVVIDPREEFKDERRVWETIFADFSSGVAVVDTKSDFLAEHEHCDVIHFACHGRSSLVDYAKSGLDIDNERLSFSEVLDDLNLLQCRNVTLAACETGAATLTSHTRDEYSGLDCSFILSGASSTVATLWSVSHSVSVLFSWFFYTMVLGAGVSPGYALIDSNTFCPRERSRIYYAQCVIGMTRKEIKNSLTSLTAC
jgi:CHAT domain-containing protein